jgi:ribosomal protein L29
VESLQKLVESLQAEINNLRAQVSSGRPTAPKDLSLVSLVPNWSWTEVS